jgi:hypothetical protein
MRISRVKKIYSSGDTCRITTDSALLKRLSTVRAEGKIRLHLPAARGAPLLPPLSLSIHTVTGFVENSVAMVTDQKGDASFYRKNGDKEKAHIVIYPLERNTKLPA